MKLTVATCQFPVSSDIRKNLRYVLRQMESARGVDADVAHFPEACLSGYAGTDFASHEGFDWDLLRASIEEVMKLARRLGLWVILGSAHPLTEPNKPHNSLYVISSDGEIVDRYDKLFCAGDEFETTGDLAHYTPGDHLSVFEISGLRCGLLICHDYRYPELYREYRRRGVRMMFHSYHAGNISPSRFRAMTQQVGPENQRFNPGRTIPGITMPATMISEAANNHLWISCPNSSARESCWPSFSVRPDGVITGRLRRNVAGVLISTVNTDEDIYDSTAEWRERAMDGILHSGSTVRDERSDDRKNL